ncbi:ATP-dependent helicase [Corynebacterium alimapuense]|uniref:UvrD-like helicase C-terminal domain-containing protein n=1 Tax=Corynebacterium alimapuense TaxID=1576874 RepID=A0A3M8K5D2_9CORY|nr:ATP-dependent helicase [Corynebacterium alimapuense]RNE48433.1 hypothetical protein C5L39_07945 [Corynebacterium alimapuense]
MSRFSLDESQQAVANLHYADCRVVIAGPGTGKTTTSVALLEKLDSSVPNPEDHSVLYISFSRSAIQAAFSSTEHMIDSLDISVDQRTVDSLALEIVNEFEPRTEHLPDFEARIKRATFYLQEHGSDLTYDICHVIVDEAQDISGCRREFLCELMRQAPDDCGLTIFADPAQSIYSFLDTADEYSEQRSIDESWIEFIDELSSIRQIEIIHLRGQYRAQNERLKSIFSHLESARSIEGYLDNRLALDELQSEIPAINLKHLSKMVDSWHGSTALLTSGNAEALQIFQILRNEGIEVEIVLKSELCPCLPSWLGEWAILSDSRSASFSSDQFRKFSRKLPNFQEEDALSLGIHLDSSSELYWNDISKQAAKLVHTPHKRTLSSGFTISTIHQSKGLEYDNVLIYDPEALVTPSKRSDSSLEMLFVAISRARRRLLAVLPSESIEKVYTKFGRWIIPTFRRHSPKAIYIDSQDIRNDKLFGGRDGQLVLTKVDAQSKLSFRLLDLDQEVPIYRCYIDNQHVALTTEEFGKTVKRLTNSTSANWPLLGPVPVQGTESSINFLVDEGRPFLIPRPLGFASISFSNRKGY